MYWQQRGGEKWILQGDANTSFFFHRCANGRTRKKRIITLEKEGGSGLLEGEELKQHVTKYYKKLFG